MKPTQELRPVIYVLVALGLLIIGLIAFLRRRSQNRNRSKSAPRSRDKHGTQSVETILPPSSSEGFPVEPCLTPILELAAVPPRRIRSSLPGVFHEVNLASVTCSCETFRNECSTHPKDSPARLCRHLSREILRSPQSAQWDELLKAVISENSRKEQYVIVRLTRGGVVAVGWSRGQPWADVFARKRRPGEREGRFTGKSECFGFSTKESRWSYKDGPPGAYEIREVLTRILR